MKQERNPSDELPEALIARLRMADESIPIITARVDREISNLASQQFSSRPDKRRVAPMWFAVAATMVLAVFLIQSFERTDTGTAELYSDVDGSGQIDIADVMALARRSDQAASDAALAAFAMRVVSLKNDGDAS